MSTSIWNSWTGRQLITYEWIVFAITVPFVAIRLYVQLWFRARPWREVFTVLSLATFMAVVIGHTVLDHHGFYTPSFKFNEENAEPILKAFVVNMMCYCNSIYFAKFVLLFFYLDLTPRHIFPRTWWLIMFTWLENIVGCGYAIMYELTTCFPIWKLWSLKDISCWDNKWFFLSAWVFNILSELLVYAIPFIILRNLIRIGSLSPSEKRASYWMLAAGFVNAALSFQQGVWNILNTAGAHGNAVNSTLYNFGTSTWIATTIMIVCLPQCRRLWLGLSEEKMRAQREQRRHRAAWTTAGDGDAHPIVAIGDPEKGNVKQEKWDGVNVVVTRYANIDGPLEKGTQC